MFPCIIKFQSKIWLMKPSLLMFWASRARFPKLTLRPLSGQHGTIALNLFAIYLGTAWTTRLYVNFINRINYFFTWSVFQRIILTYIYIFFFFWVRHHLWFSLRLSLSCGILRYGYVWFERVRDKSHWKSKKTFAKKRRNIIF